MYYLDKNYIPTITINNILSTMSMKRKTTLYNIFVNIMITEKIQYYVTQCDTTQEVTWGS